METKLRKQLNVYIAQKTYYLPEALLIGLDLKCGYERVDKSKVVREALVNFIEDKYFNTTL